MTNPATLTISDLRQERGEIFDELGELSMEESNESTTRRKRLLEHALDENRIAIWEAERGLVKC